MGLSGCDAPSLKSWLPAHGSHGHRIWPCGQYLPAKDVPRRNQTGKRAAPPARFEAVGDRMGPGGSGFSAPLDLLRGLVRSSQKEAAPTAAAMNCPGPAAPVVPESTSSPTDFGTESDSPVKFDSSSPSPGDECRCPSAATWSPVHNSTRSPSTIAVVAIYVSFPSRTTRAVGACRRANWSNFRFAEYS